MISAVKCEEHEVQAKAQQLLLILRPAILHAPQADVKMLERVQHWLAACCL